MPAPKPPVSLASAPEQAYSERVSSSVGGEGVSVPASTRRVRASTESETYRWVRRAVALAFPILAVNSIFTAFADNMPASHHLAALIAAPVFVIAWAIEISGVRWPRLALIAVITIPNLWLTLIGHTETNYLFLALLVGWVAFTGTLAEGLIALALAFGTIVLGVAMYVAPAIGGIPWEASTEWLFSLILTWFLGLSLQRQERLVVQLGQRTQELGMLLTVSRSVAATLEMRPLLNTVFDALATVVDYSASAVLMLNEARDTLTLSHVRASESHTALELQRTRYLVADLGADWERLSQGDPVVVPDVRVAASTPTKRFGGQTVRSVMWIPLSVRQQITGVLAVARPVPDGFDAGDVTLALAIAQQAAVAIDNTRLHERARQAAVLEERQRLARELHDSVTQALYGISLYAEAADRALADGETGTAATHLRELRETAKEALGEMRLLLYELRPPLLEEHGLAAALQARLKAVETRAGLVTEFVGEPDQRLAPQMEQELYRLAQEALNNVLKHAHAQHVRVCLATGPASAGLEISDDGVGFECALRGGEGFGLPGMRERAHRLGGELRVESSPGGGTRIRVEVPR